MTRTLRALSAVAALTAVALVAIPGVARAYPSKGGAVETGTTTLRFDGRLRAALERAEVRILPIKPGVKRNEAIALPINEGVLEPRFGTGYVFQRGGIRLRAGRRIVALKRLVLNTNKRRLSGRIAGDTITIAAVDDVKARRSDLGILVEVGTLRLTLKAATVLAERLGLPEVFRVGRPLGRAFVSTQLTTVPVTSGSLEFSLDEGFCQKLESLGVAIVPHEAATPLSSIPLAFRFPAVIGDVNRDLSHGAIGTGSDGLRLVQSGAPEPREVLWGGLAIGFENGFGGEGSDVVMARWRPPLGISAVGPIGQIEFGSAPSFDRSRGTIAGSPAFATLSPWAVAPLNEAFAAGKGQPFVTGEPLGTFTFAVGLR